MYPEEEEGSGTAIAGPDETEQMDLGKDSEFDRVMGVTRRRPRWPGQ